MCERKLGQQAVQDLMSLVRLADCIAFAKHVCGGVSYGYCMVFSKADDGKGKCIMSVHSADTIVLHAKGMAHSCRHKAAEELATTYAHQSLRCLLASSMQAMYIWIEVCDLRAVCGRSKRRLGLCL